MKQLNLKLVWKIFTLIISVILFFHFLKDITQDLFNVNTPLDLMDNIQEDTAKLPRFLIPIYWLMWGIATIAQPIIGYLTYKNWKSVDFNKSDLIILGLITFFCLMISWAYLLSL